MNKEYRRHIRVLLDLEGHRVRIGRLKGGLPIALKKRQAIWLLQDGDYTGEGIGNIDSIIDASDGIMIARGDMGVSIPIYEIPMVQKEIIKKCNKAKKFVITATQMLESMVENIRPTRAEVTDIANAILDGTDFVMLSAETAVGKHPVEAVRMMNQVIRFTEGSRLKISHFPT